MIDLDRLMALKGVFAAGEFGVGGSLIRYRGELAPAHAELAAMICAASSLTARMETESFSRESGLNWRPLKGWSATGGDYTLCVMGEIGVFVETDQADFNELFKVLREEADMP